MKRALLTIVLVLSIASLIGCDSSSSVQSQQSVNEMQWLPDGSGLLAVLVHVSQDPTTGSQSYEAGLYRVRADGSIGDRFNIADKALPQGYPTPIAIAKDGQTAVTELGTTVYRVNIGSLNSTALIRNQYLMGASQSLKYAVVTETDGTLHTRFCAIYDISGAQTRQVIAFVMNGVNSLRAIWLGDSAFAVSGTDSTGEYETQIYDTTGRVSAHIKNSIVDSYSYLLGKFYYKKLSAYARDTGAFFLFDPVTQGLERYDLMSGTHRTALSNDTIEMVDVTPSGNLVAYSSGSGNASFSLFALNPTNGNRAQIATGAFEVALAPQGDKVAYSTVEAGYLGVNIRVLPITIP